MQDSKLLRPEETAELLGISQDSLRRMACNGMIDYIRTIGGQRRYPQSEVDRILSVGEDDYAIRAKKQTQAAREVLKNKRKMQSGIFSAADVASFNDDEPSSKSCTVETVKPIAKAVSMDDVGQQFAMIKEQRNMERLFVFDPENEASCLKYDKITLEDMRAELYRRNNNPTSQGNKVLMGYPSEEFTEIYTALEMLYLKDSNDEIVAQETAVTTSPPPSPFVQSVVGYYVQEL